MAGDDRADYIDMLGESAICPLSAEEICLWAGSLGRAGASGERELKELLTIAFWSANCLLPGNVTDRDRRERLDELIQGIAARLVDIASQLSALPEDLQAAVRVRFIAALGFRQGLDVCGKTSIGLSLMPVILQELGKDWPKPHPGKPSLEPYANAIETLAEAVEEFTGKQLPSPRSRNKYPDIDLIRLIASRLPASLNDAQIKTVLRHVHDRRLRAAALCRPRPAN